MNNNRDFWIEETNDTITKWNQGDYVLGEHWFVRRCNIDKPLTKASEEAANEGIDLVEEEIRGFVVVTQTCDIVRSCYRRPYVEVVPLVEVNHQQLTDIKKGRRPQYAYIARAAELKLVADLDRVMTVEKSCLLEWEQKQGCQNDTDKRMLGQALARKRARCAFPDDFIQFVSNLQDRIKKKHSKSSDEGDALRVLREIRVRASPDWNYEEIELFFWFIRDEQQIDFNGEEWDLRLDKWLELIPESGRFKQVDGLVTTLEDITAKDYVESDPLDLDHLSSLNL